MVTTPFNAATAAYGNASRLINQAAKPTTDLSAAAGARAIISPVCWPSRCRA